ncbi:MAG: MerR family transcriptional regulator [Ramlibacter sp.]|jgi:chaperone modulatory protein CbpM|nr:MerR family transcriptional regulator [Ramlibacter sp.]MDB5915262.1 MerR family transcriptional regulator [Ramlibacter sp.]
MEHKQIHHGEVLGDAAFTIEDVARACGMQVGWVRERVDAGVLQVNPATGEWRFDSATLVRARRVAWLETGFDADPQLAALTADLIEEVEQLRRRMHRP